MTRARHERDRAPGLVGRFREMPPEGDEHGQAVTVVPGAIKPPVNVRVEHDHFVGRAANDGDAVVRLESAEGLRLQVDLDAYLVLRAGLRGAIENGFEEQPVAPADVE